MNIKISNNIFEIITILIIIIFILKIMLKNKKNDIKKEEKIINKNKFENKNITTVKTSFLNEKC